MAFNAAGLGALIQGNGFTLWHYRTTDSRAACTAAGYFSGIAATLRPGDVMVLHAADSLAVVPVRSGPALGTGITLDGVVGPLNTVRSVAQQFAFAQAAAAVVRTIVLAPLAASIAVGGSIPVSAHVTGPVAEVVFTLRDGNGTILPPAIAAPVSNGVASAIFPAQAQGTGYRIRAEHADAPEVAVVSPSFNVGADLRFLLAEDDGNLLLESGAGLKQ